MKDSDAPTSPQTSTQETGEYWSKKLQGSAFTPECCWRAVPEVDRRRIFRETGGSPYSHWAEYCVREHLAGRVPVERMLSLGCGTGRLERILARLGAFRQCDAWDVAAGAIEAARDLAHEEGFAHIHYSVKDVTTEDMPADRYDAVWFENALHHIEPLEEVCAKVARTLKPDGYLFLNEYIGPNRFAFPPRQRELVRAAFALIPARFRRHRESGTILTSASLPTPAEVEADDPTESIRSSDIPDVVASRFDVVAFHKSGGSLLQFLLNGIAGNFRDDDPESMLVIDMLLRLEDELLEIGELHSDFAVIVARPRQPVGRPVEARTVPSWRPQPSELTRIEDAGAALSISLEDELAQKRAALAEASRYARNLETELDRHRTHQNELERYARNLEAELDHHRTHQGDQARYVRGLEGKLAGQHGPDTGHGPDPDPGELLERIRSLGTELEGLRPRVHAVIVHHRGEALLDACLGRLLASRDIRLQVVIVANDCREPLPPSAQASAGASAEVTAEPPVYVVSSALSLGFSAANNLGVDWARRELGEPDCWLFLNNDAGVEPDTLSRLAGALAENPGVGIAGPLLRIWGAEDHLNSLGLNVTLSGEAWDEGIGQAIADYAPLPPQREVLAVTGSAMLVRSKVLSEIGGWNDLYGYYMEDIDLCLQARARGWTVLLVPSAVADHAISATSDQITDFKVLLSWRNQLVLVLRHWPLGTLLRAAPHLIGAQLFVFWKRLRIKCYADARLQARAWGGALRLFPRALGQRLRGGGNHAWTRELRPAGSVPAIRLPVIAPGRRPWETSAPERSQP